ncbi:hypothetical protein CDO52_24270 [Nocardiopsis gilva YIM 90087]|uniref:Uncharacterized protein n=1 Tax=Nocardiopsis gilva YIM 90087 TaxID=1235441 RepID=A0A223SBV2_9ACTN|nr:hypothetical protein [Nocardiopsis gilva]ASU85499.1 hypothetical protein CDO52_24270 [Nocardiopsis gilva YIM 90087]
MRVATSRVLADDVLELVLSEPGPTSANLVCKPVGKLKESGVAQKVVPLRINGDRALADLGGLANGTWALRWEGPDSTQRPILTTDPCYDAAEAEDYASRARTRAFSAVRTSTGRLRVKARAVRPHAEVRGVRTTGERITVTGFLAYAPEPTADAAAQLVVRGRHRESEEDRLHPVELTGRSFVGRIPLRPLAEAHDAAREHNEWDLWLRVPGLDTDVRLGSHVDDIVGKKGRLSFLETRIGAGTATIGLRPYYTVKDGLSLLGVAVTGDVDGADEDADDADSALCEAA